MTIPKMKRYLYGLLFFLLFVSACDDPYDQSTKTPMNHTHEYGDDHGHDHHTTPKATVNKRPASTVQRDLTDVPSEDMQSNRWMWQKPNLIIDLLGDLTGKTVADIGAGPYGFFSFRIALNNPKKIIAIDIDTSAIEFMEKASELLKENKDRFETRLVLPEDPKLKEGEADIVLIVNTYVYIENAVNYLKTLRKGIAKGGKLMIIDYKMKDTPILDVPSELKVPVNRLQRELVQAGFKQVKIDDTLLPYQYIVTAMNY